MIGGGFPLLLIRMRRREGTGMNETKDKRCTGHGQCWM